MCQLAYVENRIYNKALKCSPHENFTDTLPSIHYIRVFGSDAFVYNESPKIMVHAQASLAIYFGSDDNGVFKCKLLTTRKAVYSLNDTFDEKNYPAM